MSETSVLADDVSSHVVAMATGWFDACDGRAPLYGAYHAPADGAIRGVAVLCPPLGLEMMIAHRTMRLLADRLAAAGFGALRLDYAGRGNSLDAEAPSEVSEWVTSVRDAVAFARRSGAGSIVLVGMRAGALLAAAAAEGCGPLDALVLWDPPESGTVLLREERALFKMGLSTVTASEHADGSVEGPGMLYQAESVAAFRGMDLAELVAAALPSVGVISHRESGAAPDPTSSSRVLILCRQELRSRKAMARAVALPGTASMNADAQSDLFDWAKLWVPGATASSIVEWLSDRAPRARTSVPIGLQDAAVVGHTPHGEVVTEQIVRVGPRGLFGILATTQDSHGPLILFTNAAAPAHNIGPARLWVDLGRRLALDGLPVLRFDDWDVGDSPWSGELVPVAPYTDDAVRDIVDAVAAAAAYEQAGRVSVVGLCSAAWASLVAASRCRVEHVYAVNPVIWHPRPNLSGRASLTAAGVLGPSLGPALARPRSRMRRALRAAVPEFLWWRLALAGYVTAPSGLVTALLRRGGAVTLVFGHKEAAAFHRRRGQRLLDRFRRTGALRVYESDRIDHGLMSHAARDYLCEALHEWIVQCPTPPPGQLRRR